MNVGENDYSSLRLTILKHQWKESYQLAAALLAKNVPQSTVFVANQMARSCLRFQSRYDLGWVTRFAQEVTQFIRAGYAGDEAPKYPKEIYENHMDLPEGAGNLIGGVRELWWSVSVAQHIDEKAHHLATAINNIIIAELANYWEIVHPEEMQLQEIFRSAKTTPEGKKLLPPDIDQKKLIQSLIFLRQPESLGYHSARLLSIVDDIELMLSSESKQSF
jgi:hypothetical protein